MQSVQLVYGGLATPAANLPLGTVATYSGGFVGGWRSGAAVYNAIGNVTLTADFASPGITPIVDFESTGYLSDMHGLPGVYRITGTAAVTGNVFASAAGGMSGETVMTGSGAVDSGFAGTMEGGFFGPTAGETVGILMLESSATGAVLYGGFRAEMD